jgi:NAD(P)-dependent dehydrogenase (short-subunit alcohol dehydrogenase family)
MKGGVTAVGTDARAAGADVVIDFRDLAEEGAGEGLVGATVASFGRIDQIISNAGFADKRRAGDFDLQDYRASNATM